MKTRNLPTAIAVLTLFLSLALPATAMEKLVAPDGKAGDKFGYHVGIDGEWAVVGAPFVDGSDDDVGAADVFRLVNGSWTHWARLQSADPLGGAEFGAGVGISGETIVVAARGAGRVHVFRLDGTVWKVAQVVSDPTEGFGRSIAIDGATIAVGANNSVFAYVESGGAFTLQQELLSTAKEPSVDMARTVGISGDTIIAGSDDNYAHVFFRTGGNWTEQAKLRGADTVDGDRFGWLVAIDGDTAVVGAHLDEAPGLNAGSAYVFRRKGGAWTEVQKLPHSGAGSYNYFGCAVAISGQVILVGEWGRDGAGGYNAGAVHVYRPVGGAWKETKVLLTPTDAGWTYFGHAVAVSGNFAIAGAYLDKAPESESGSAWVFPVAQKFGLTALTEGANFGHGVGVARDAALVGAPGAEIAVVHERSGQEWRKTAELTAADQTVGDRFGFSTALDGDLAVVGAPAGGPTGVELGAAYVFERVNGAWTQKAKLAPPVPTDGDWFGVAVAISQGTVVVGAYEEDHRTGAAYVYRLAGGTWNLTQRLLAPQGSSGDVFGIAVAIYGDLILVGAPSEDGYEQDTGAAHVFVRTQGTWTHEAAISLSNAAKGQMFGVAVGIDEDRAVIGAFGQAGVFERSGGAWSERRRLVPSDPDDAASFGLSVAISGDTVAVGSQAGTGAAYVFTYTHGAWIGQSRLLPADGTTGTLFGMRVALCGNSLLVGAPFDGDAGQSGGAVYSFAPVGAPIPALTIVNATFPESTTGLSFALDLEHEGGLRLPFTWSVTGDFPITGGIEPETGRVDGVFDAPGDYSFAVRVTDGYGQVAERSFTTRVNAWPTLGLTSLPAAAVGRPYHADLGMAGGTGGLDARVVSGSLPAGLAFDRKSGVISGTPTAAGRTSVGFRAEDALGAESDELSDSLVAMPVGDLTAKKLRRDVALASDGEPLALELVAGTLLSVKVKFPKGSTDAAALRILDPDGKAMSLGLAYRAKPKSLSLKKLPIPETGRYFLVLDRASGFASSVRLDVKVKAPTKCADLVTVAKGETGALVFGALPGATFTVQVKASRNSNALPAILSVLDGDGSELLVPEDLAVRGAKSTLTVRKPIAGGKVTVMLGTLAGTAGPMSVKVRIKEPGEYGYSRPSDTCSLR